MAFTKKPLKWTALGQEPSELKKSEGFKMDESPAPGHFDFMFRSTYEAIEELQQKAGEVKTINNTLPNTAGNISVTKSTVGLSNVDNTSDANKPISNATKTELDKKYAKPTTGIPKTDLESSVQTSLTKAESALQSVTKTDVGLSNVDNTSDADKPISNAQQAEFNKKANLASPVFTGTPKSTTAAAGTNTTQIATTAFVKTAVDNSATTINDSITTHKLDNVSHNTYVNCTTASATAEKVVTATGFTLVPGARITVNFTNANSALSPTLKINTNVAKPIVQNDGKPFEKILNGVYEFLYNGTSFIVLNNGGGGVELPDLVKNNGVALYDLSVNNQLTRLPSISSSGNSYKNIVIDDVLYSFDAKKLYTTNLKTYAQSVIDLPPDLTIQSDIFRLVNIGKVIYIINTQDFRKYDITNNAWTKIALPTNITSNTSNRCGIAVDGLYIYLTGVFGVVRYNTTTNIFNTETTTYPSNVFTSPSYVGGSGYANGNIYTLGYANSNLAIYNLNTKTWSSVVISPTGASRWESKVVILNNKILALTLISSVLIFDYISSTIVNEYKTAQKSYEYAYLTDNMMLNVLENGYFYLMQITEG